MGKTSLDSLRGRSATVKGQVTIRNEKYFQFSLEDSFCYNFTTENQEDGWETSSYPIGPASRLAVACFLILCPVLIDLTGRLNGISFPSGFAQMVYVEGAVPAIQRQQLPFLDNLRAGTHVRSPISRHLV